MTDKELERRVAQALSRSAPNDLDGVLSRCETRKGTVIPMTMNRNNKKKVWKNLIAACLALVLVGGGGGLVYQQSYAVASVVSLDVNPSIELSVNKSEKVLVCTPLNAEASEVLADMGGGADLKGTKLDVAVNAIVGSLVRHGYLDSISSAILISVEDKDQARAAKLRQELTQTVDAVLQDQASGANVLSQTVAKDTQLEQQAKEHSITTGKAALVNQVLALNDTLNFEALAELSVEELRDLVETRAPGMPVGIEAARQAAMDYAGLASLDGARADVDPELDELVPHYEVELEGSFGEFDYHVDAYTGKVFSGKADILKGQQTTAQQPAVQQPANTEPTTEPTTEPAASTTTATPTPTTPPVATTPTTSAVTDIGRDKAKAAALAHAGLKESAVTAMRVEQDRDDGRLEYEVEFWQDGTEYDYTIDAASGAVLKYDVKQPVQTQPATSTTPAVTDIGRDEAKAAALAHAGLKESAVTAMRVEQDRDDGRLEYEVEFWQDGAEYDYTIDAASGAVLKYDVKQPVQTQPAASSTNTPTTSKPTTSTSDDIGQDGAKAAALAHAGLKESEVSRLKVERDRDDGRLEYEVEFRANGLEYEYTIDATSGAVLEHESDWDD